MSNNPMLHYKQEITLGQSIPVYMAAADWLNLMTWACTVNTEGAPQLIFGVISEQIAEQIYTPASVKAATASYHQQAEDANPLNHIIRHMTGQPTLDPEDFEDDDE